MKNLEEQDEIFKKSIEKAFATRFDESGRLISTQIDMTTSIELGEVPGFMTTTVTLTRVKPMKRNGDN